MPWFRGKVTGKGQKRAGRADNTGMDSELLAWSVTPYLEGCPKDLKSGSVSCEAAVSRKAVCCYICGGLLYCLDFSVRNDETSSFPSSPLPARLCGSVWNLTLLS